MGRPLFSRKYATAPPVRIEPEHVVGPLCQKWSATNSFNPDSDDFFANAQEERVLLPGERQHIPTGRVETELIVASSPSLSESTEGSESELEASRESPARDPEVRVGRVVDGQWGQQLRDSGAEASEWLLSTTAMAPAPSVASSVDPSREGIADGTTAGPYRSNLPRSEPTPPALIPAAFLAQTRPAEPISTQTPTPPLSPPLQQSTLPAAIEVAAADANRRPSPEDSSSVQAVLPLDAPMTPQRNNVRGAAQTMFTPSPPPSVTPRFYSWQSHAIPALPTSPTRFRGARDGPLTNPLARRSLLRIGTGQAPVLVSNTAN